MQTNSGVIEIYRVMGREELCLKNMSSVRGEKKKRICLVRRQNGPRQNPGGKAACRGQGGKLMKKSEKE